MNKEKFKNFAKIVLKDILDMPGGILYSSHATIQKNDIYLMGTNPGGRGGNNLKISIENFFNSENEINAYLDEEWENERDGHTDKGQAPLQKRVQSILEGLGYKTRDVCATNLIFTQSRNLNELGFDFFKIADICWKVHLQLLSIIQPKVILVFGNGKESPYNYLKKKYKIKDSNENNEASGYSNWKFKSFKTKEYIVVGLPHLTFQIDTEKSINFIKSCSEKSSCS